MTLLIILQTMSTVKWLQLMNKVHRSALITNKIKFNRKNIIMITGFKLNSIQNCKIWKIAHTMTPQFNQIWSRFANPNTLKKILKWLMTNSSLNLMQFNQTLIKNLKMLNFPLKLRTRKKWWKMISFLKRMKNIQIAHLMTHSNKKLIWCIRKVRCKLFYQD